MTRRSVFGTIVVLAVTVSAWAGSGGPERGTHPESRGKGAQAPRGAKAKGEGGESVRIFSSQHERIIRDWFQAPSNVKGLPPGLAKRETLPPGLQKQLHRNGSLPPGLEKKLHPLPSDLEVLLPGLPSGVRRVILGEHVILLDERSSAILDILHGAARLAGTL